MLFLQASILVSDRHQVPLDDPRNFDMFTLTSSWTELMLTWRLSPIFLLRWDENHASGHDLTVQLVLIGNYHLAVGSAVVKREFLRRPTTITSTIPTIRPLSARTRDPHGWVATRVISKPIDFKVSKEEDVFIVLLQYDLKHEGVEMLFFTLVLGVFYVEGLH